MTGRAQAGILVSTAVVAMMPAGAQVATVGLTLAPTPESSHPQLPRADEIYGEREVRSDHPVVRQMTIVVVMIGQSWGNPWGVVECPR